MLFYNISFYDTIILGDNVTREEMNKDIQEEIEDEKRKEQRKKIAIIVIKVLAIIFIVTFSFLCYNKYISTKVIVVKEKRITTNRIPSSFNGTKIIQFSDLQYGSSIFIDDVDDLVKKINLRNPDIIVFTGDLIDSDYSIKSDETEKLIKSLSKLESSIGKYAVNGDEDNDSFTTVLTQAGFNVLDNSYDLVYNGENNPILITGLSSSNKNRDVDKAFGYYKDEKNNKDIYSVLIMHEADTIDQIINNYNVDIALAGGNLNGMIYVPKLGGIITRKKASKYMKPYYKLNNTQLYISSGIGTDNIGIRLFNRPSFNFIRLALSSH